MRTLPFRVSGFATLSEGLDYAAQGETGCNFFSARGELQQALPYRELRGAPAIWPGAWLGLGLARGDRVAIVAETSPDFLEFFFACQYAGLMPVPLPLCINFGGREAYVERLRGMLRTAGARVAVAPEDLIDTLRDAAAGTEARTWSARRRRSATWPAAARPCRPLGADEPCYIQYSSGSTSFPRGVLVTQRAIAANAAAIADHGLDAARRRPLHLLAAALSRHGPGRLLPDAGHGADHRRLSPDAPAFARRPLLWLKLLSDQGGTISFAPTFGYELCARRAASADCRKALDLVAWRVAGIGGEMIRARVLAGVRRALRRRRASTHSAFLPSYGLAEATLAVTFSTPGQGLQVDVVVAAPRSRSSGGRCRPTPNVPGQASRARLRHVRPADAGLRGRDPRRRRIGRCRSG